MMLSFLYVTVDGNEEEQIDEYAAKEIMKKVGNSSITNCIYVYIINILNISSLLNIGW